MEKDKEIKGTDLKDIQKLLDLKKKKLKKLLDLKKKKLNDKKLVKK
jgi:hypothetical protein